MIKIDGYKIIQYSSGYELHEPYQAKSKINGIETKTTKHRVTYWPTLKHACMKLLDVKSGKYHGVSQIVNKMEECTRRIEQAIEELKQ